MFLEFLAHYIIKILRKELLYTIYNNDQQQSFLLFQLFAHLMLMISIKPKIYSFKAFYHIFFLLIFLYQLRNEYSEWLNLSPLHLLLKLLVYDLLLEFKRFYIIFLDLIRNTKEEFLQILADLIYLFHFFWEDSHKIYHHLLHHHNHHFHHYHILFILIEFF